MTKYLRLFLVLTSALGLTALFLLILPTQQALQASTSTGIVVNSLIDEDSFNGHCSLREAIRAASENAQVDTCPAGDAGMDRITFLLPGTITLTEQLRVTGDEPLVIDGAGQITISGSGSIRIFLVDAGADLTLDGLTIVDGYADDQGGGIYNNGSLTLIKSTLSSNYAGNEGGAISNKSAGTLTIIDSTLMDNIAVSFHGGGVYNDRGTLTIDGSTFIGNHADQGGGIGNEGVTTITNSTFSGNSANAGGGGINQITGTLTLNNSTLSDNRSDEGGIIYMQWGTLTARGSIVANSALSDNCAGNPIIDAGYNIENTNTCGLDPASGSLPDTDPLLGPLQDNGGSTLTYALMEDSPAIDAGDLANCPPTDQRGIVRPLDGDRDGVAVCDIGSYEFSDVIHLEPTMQSSSGIRGDSLTYTIDLMNKTDFSDSYTLTLGSHAWETVLSTEIIGPIHSDETQSFNVMVAIPMTATENMSDTVIVSATSVTSPTLYFAAAKVTTQVAAPPPKFYLPLVVIPPQTIYGYVTESGIPAGGIELELRYFDGYSWYTTANATTYSNGRYSFHFIHDLSPGELYYVLFRNPDNPNRLWVWATKVLTSYKATTSLNIGNFDIATIPFLSPANGENVLMPYTFRWKPRPATPWDSYEFNLFDPQDEDPYFWTDPPLGYVGSYTLSSLPPGFSNGHWYIWNLWVYSPDGGYGISYDARWVAFGGEELNGLPTQQTAGPKLPPEREHLLKR